MDEIKKKQSGLLEDLNNKLKKKGKDKDKEEIRMYEIEHSYIDFKFLIIGEKVRHKNEPERLNKLKYDDEYFSELLLEQDEDADLYMKPTINKIIDF